MRREDTRDYRPAAVADGDEMISDAHGVPWGLGRVLEPHTDADATLVYQNFRRTVQSKDLGKFVDYMVKQGLLPADSAPHVEAELRAARDAADRLPRAIGSEYSERTDRLDAYETVAEPRVGRSAGSGSRSIGGSRSESGARSGTGSPRSGTVAEGKALLDTPRLPTTNVRLLEVIGRGGMGLVFKGHQLELDRAVAFKQLIDHENGVLRERFLREARITAQLDHPNIVPVHLLELTAEGQAVGYAMKLVEGKTLRTLIAETAEAYQQRVRIDAEHALTTRLEHFIKICDALAFAHARGILHRDLKPANFMIGKFGEVYVMDWGVARPIGAAETLSSGAALQPIAPDLTQDGDIIGSPSYMAPEQANAGTVVLDARADQYALGLILFEIVALRKAVDGSSTLDVYDQAARGAKAPFVHISKREKIPVELRAIVHKATAFAPADRYASVTDLADDVRRYLRGDAVAARPDGPVSKIWRVMARHRRATVVSILGVIALAALAVSLTLYRQTARELATKQRGERVTQLYIDVAAQGHRIDVQFQRMEAGLEGLRTAAEWALVGPEPPTSTKLYFDHDFSDPAKRPADFTKQTSYRWPVSIDQLVVGVAPGVEIAKSLPAIRRAAALGDYMRAMVLTAGGLDPSAMTPEARRERLLSRSSPIDYAYVDLPEGIHIMYPGMDALPPGYDVRTAGFYQISLNQHGHRWGRPYVDSTTDQAGDDLVLPCTQGLWSPTGQFLGVAGVEITVTKLVETELAMPNRKTLRTSLLNGEGQKVIDSRDAGQRFQASGRDEGLTLYDFDAPEIVKAVRSGSEGLRVIRRENKDVLAVFVRLDVLGWYYVVEVDASTIGEK